MSDAVGLAFEHVAVSLGGREVLRDIQLAIPTGRMTALVGRNGAGKTTLLRVASRVVRTAAGRVTLRGRPVESFSRRELASEVAVVPQDATFAFPFSAAEVVLMGRSPHLGVLGFESSRDFAIARESMERLEIDQLADRSILELSGGERQLVLIARALTQQPRVLLLDEPTAHLDLAHRIAVLDLVRDFARDGGTALLVSHDLSLTARSCDLLALLADGRVLASGTPTEVLTPEHLLEAFSIRAEVVSGPDGEPLVIPKGRSARPR